MRARRLLHLFIAMSGLFFLLHPGDTWAKKGNDTEKQADSEEEEDEDSIQETGIESFDAVFAQVDEIDKKIKKARRKRRKGRTGVTTALDIKKSATLADAMAELKTRAEGKVEVTMKGNTPELSASDAVPEDVQTAIDATNEAVANYKDVIKTIKTIPKDCQELIAQTKEFPKQFKDEVKNLDLDGFKEKLAMAKTVKNNVKITAGIPDRAKSLVQDLKDDFVTIKDAFSKDDEK